MPDITDQGEIFVLLRQFCYFRFRIPTVTAQTYISFSANDFHDFFDHISRHSQFGLFLRPHPIANRKRQIAYFPLIEYRNGQHDTDKTVTVQIIGAVVSGMVKKLFTIFKMFPVLFHHRIVYGQENQLRLEAFWHQGQSYSDHIPDPFRQIYFAFIQREII